MNGWSVRIISWGLGPSAVELTWREARDRLKADGLDVEFEGGSNFTDAVYFSCPMSVERGFVRELSEDDYQRLNGKRFAVANASD